MKLFRVKKKQKKSASKFVNPLYRIISIEEPNSVVAESYRRAKVSLDFASVDHKIQVLMCSSAVSGEGKTTNMLNLAAVIAEDKKKVLVLDLDLRKPKTHRAARSENKEGVTDVLAGKCELEAAIKHSENLPFDILNRGSKVPNPNALLGSKELADLIEKLRGMYDMILVDCPPVLAVSDCMVVAPLTDACIYIVSQNASDKNASIEAVKTLRDNNVIGCLFVGIDSKKYGKYGSYNHYYYSGYYNEQSK